MQAAVRPGARPANVLDEVTQRGTKLYETQLQATLEREHLGEMVAIHPDSGAFAVAAGEEEALRRLRAKRPEGLVFMRRIGPPTPADQRLAARLTGRLRGK
jgi:hypothetical protein